MPEPSNNDPNSNYTALATSIGGASAGIFFIAAVFNHSSLWPAAAAVAALAVMGIAFAYFTGRPR